MRRIKLFSVVFAYNRTVYIEICNALHIVADNPHILIRTDGCSFTMSGYRVTIIMSEIYRCCKWRKDENYTVAAEVLHFIVCIIFSGHSSRISRSIIGLKRVSCLNRRYISEYIYVSFYYLCFFQTFANDDESWLWLRFAFIRFIRSSRWDKAESANRKEILSLYRTSRVRAIPLFPCPGIYNETDQIISLLWISFEDS